MSATSKNLIENVTWNLGGSDDDTWENYTASRFYEFERGTIVYSGHPTRGEEYIGLMSPSDYGYAVISSSCPRTQTLFDYDSSSCKNNNWLFKDNDIDEWTLTPYSAFFTNVFNVGYHGGMSYVNADSVCAARPSLYLKSNTTMQGGDGTSINPYIISE